MLNLLFLGKQQFILLLELLLLSLFQLLNAQLIMFVCVFLHKLYFVLQSLVGELASLIQVVLSDQPAVDLMIMHRMNVHAFALELSSLLFHHSIEHGYFLVVGFIELEQSELFRFEMSRYIVAFLLHPRDVDV